MNEEEFVQRVKKCLADELYREILFSLELELSLSEFCAESKRDLGHVSKKLARLESELGISLTLWVGRRKFLTEAGLLLAKAAHDYDDRLGDIACNFYDYTHPD